MNKVNALILELTDEQLRVGVQELYILDTTGILPSGEVRNLAQRLTEQTGITGHDARILAPAEILRAAAYKWAGI